MDGDESRQSGVPSQLAANLAEPAELRDTNHESTKNGRRSRADDVSKGPSALPTSAVVTGSTSPQQTSASCHSQRVQAAPATTERRPMHG